MKYMYYNYKFMKAMAAIKTTDEDGIFYKIYFYLCRAMTLFLLTYSLISAIIKLHLSTGSTILEMTGSVLHIAIYIGAIGRVLLMYYWGDKFYTHLFHADKIFKDATETNLLEKTMQPHVKFILILYFGWLILDPGSIIFYTFIPLLTSSERTFPIPLMYPYNETASPFYEVTYFSQLLTQVVMVLNYFCIDMYYICLVYLTAAQFDLLAHEFENSLYTTLLRFGVRKEDILEFKDMLALSDPIIKTDTRFYRIYEVMNTERYAEECYHTLTPFIEHHNDLLKFCSDLEDFLSPLVLYFVMSSIFYSVFILFTAVASDGQYMKSAPYFLTVLAQTFLMAFPGQFLVEQSSKLQGALYNSPWYLCHNRFKSLFKFMQLRTSKESNISVGKFAQMDFKIYMWVMKSSFSYVTLLHSLEK